MGIGERPIVYVRLFRPARAVPPARPIAPRDLDAEEAVRAEKETGKNAVSFYIARGADRDAGLVDIAAEEQAWNAKEAERFRLESEAAQKEVEADPIDLSDKVLSFSYEQDSRGTDMMRIVLDNFDLSEFDNPVWKKGGTVEATWGYPGDMATPRRTVIKKLSGGRTFAIEAYGEDTHMNEEKLTRTWRDTNLLKLVQDVAGEYKDIFPVEVVQYTASLTSGASVTSPPPSVTSAIADKELPEATKRKDFPMIAALARKWGDIFGVPARMTFTIVQIESNWTIRVRTNMSTQAVRDRGGAWGVMQMTHKSAGGEVEALKRTGIHLTNGEVGKTLALWDGTGESLNNPDLNMLLSIFMISRLWKRFGNDYRKVAAAYNAGSSPVLRAEKLGVDVSTTVPTETKKYIRLAEANWVKYAGVGSGAVSSSSTERALAKAGPVDSIVGNQMVAPAPDPDDVALALQAERTTGVNSVSDYLGRRADRAAFEADDVAQALKEEKETGKNAVSSYLGRRADRAELVKRGIDAAALEKIKLAQVHQSAETNAQLLSRVLEKYGFVFYVDANGFVCEKFDEVYRRKPEKTLIWYHGEGDFLDFTYDSEKKEKTIKSGGVDAANHGAFNVKASNEETPRAGSGVRVSEGENLNAWAAETATVTKGKEETVARLKHFEDTVKNLPDGPAKTAALNAAAGFSEAIEGITGTVATLASKLGPIAATNPSQAKAQVDGQYKQLTSGEHQLSGKIIGDPSFLAHTMVEIQGIGRRLSGPWVVKNVTHQIGSDGYTCSFRAERDGDNGYGEADEADSKAAQPTEAEPQPKVHEWNTPSAQRLKSAVDKASELTIRDDQGRPIQ